MRKLKLGPIIFALLIALHLDCSHTKPYYGATLQPDIMPLPQANSLVYRVLLIGDAGEPNEPEPSLTLLMEWAGKAPDKTMIIFLGDNVYPQGLPGEGDPWRKEGERRLKAQTDVIKNSGASGFFIPGNHDWKMGLTGLRNQEQFVHREIGGDSTFLPKAGCPGPAVVDVHNLRIIALDSHYWVESEEGRAAECAEIDRDAVIASLETCLRNAGDRHVILVSHHPFDSYGVHGGFLDWKDHIFPLRHIQSWMWLPLPIIGSVYPLFRLHIVDNPEDLKSPGHRDMLKRCAQAFAIKKPLIWAGGHDHSLQVMEGGEHVGYALVSGGGIHKKLSTVSHGENSLFSHLHAGFMAVDFLQDGSVWLYVIEPGEKEIVFSLRLKTD